VSHMDRREFLKKALAAGSILAFGKGSDLITRVYGKTDTQKKVIVLGLDGLDPHLLSVWMERGKLPSFRRLRSQGVFKRLQTSNPPQSPVAWANFITGMDSGGHGLFDFLHRHPETYIPSSSSAETSEVGKTLSFGNYVFPLSGGKVNNLIKGKTFWQHLEDHNIPATVFKIPSNYPPVPTKLRTLSGMGTPDILGSPGIFNYFTTEPTEIKEDIGGGRIHEVYVVGNTTEAALPGPVNAFKKDRPESGIDFKVFIDPVHPVAKIVIQDHELILKQGEWSGWKRVHFRMIPTQSVSGICNFYLKEARPGFKLYVSPINIDPANPALPISTPESYSKELEKRFGPFYTQGLPADTKALEHGILDDGEFLEQDDIVLKERLEMYEYELARFDSGLLFYYLSSADQRQHMFWRHIDKQSPSHDPLAASKYENTIENIYRVADQMVDKALQKADKNTVLIVLSDHGFSPFRRSFNVNSWLKENGYIRLINEWKQGEEAFFLNTDWSKTKAYAFGLNSLYINQQGREGEGIVPPGPGKEALVREIAHKLENYVDPKTGERPVLRAFVAKDIYHGSYTDEAPEIILGYNLGYRVSWATPLGRIPKEIIVDNEEKWSGDHCIAPEVVPGILFMNRKISSDSPALHDLTPTILKIFGIEKPQEMTGMPII